MCGNATKCHARAYEGGKEQPNEGGKEQPNEGGKEQPKKTNSPVMGIQQRESVQGLHACAGALHVGVINHDVAKHFTAIQRLKQLPPSCEFISSPTSVFVLHGQEVINAELEAFLLEKFWN
jgi:hypothetical protein